MASYAIFLDPEDGWLRCSAVRTKMAKGKSSKRWKPVLAPSFLPPLRASGSLGLDLSPDMTL